MRAEDPLKKRLGARCRVLRRRRHLSQMDIVKRFDFSLSHYQKIERGDLDARLSTLKKLAGCFDVTLSVLLKGV